MSLSRRKNPFGIDPMIFTTKVNVSLPSWLIASPFPPKLTETGATLLTNRVPPRGCVKKSVVPKIDIISDRSDHVVIVIVEEEGPRGSSMSWSTPKKR